MNFDCIKDMLSCLKKKKKYNVVDENSTTETEVSCLKDNSVNYDIIDSYNGEDIIYKGIKEDKPYLKAKAKKCSKSGKKKSLKVSDDRKTGKEFFVGSNNTKIITDYEKKKVNNPKDMLKKEKKSMKMKRTEEEKLNKTPKIKKDETICNKSKKNKEKKIKKSAPIEESEKNEKFQESENKHVEKHAARKMKISKLKNIPLDHDNKTIKSRDKSMKKTKDKDLLKTKEVRLKKTKESKKENLPKKNKKEEKCFPFIEGEIIKRNTLTMDDFKKIQDSDSEICFIKNEIEIKSFNSRLRKKIKNILKKSNKDSFSYG